MHRLTANRVTLAVITALLAFIAVIGADSAQADSHATAYVSNTGQTQSGTNLRFATGFLRAQEFRTGPQAGGYSLGSVGFRAASTLDTTELAAITATIRTRGSDGNPDSVRYTLTNPTTQVATDGEAIFHAPDGATLNRNTSYFIVFDTSATISNVARATADYGEDSGASSGWSISNNQRDYIKSSSTWTTGTLNLFMIAVYPPASDADDATLSDLELEDSATNAAVSLNETFASDTTSYTATVGNDVSQITVTPTANNDEATIKYLTGAGADLTDADDETDGHQVDLPQGANTFKVKVISEDESENKFYTITVTRLVPYVSNTGQTTDGAKYPISSGFLTAQEFRTGSQSGGYPLGSAGFRAGRDLSATELAAITATIRTKGSNGNPDSVVYTLTSPATAVAADREAIFEVPDDATLDPNTSYFFVFDTSSTVTDARRVTESTAIDSGASAGWSIKIDEWRSHDKSTETWETFDDFGSFMIAVYPPPDDPDDATLRNLALEDSATDEAVGLNETFASDTTSYTATVDDDVTQITVTPTVNDYGATIEYLTGADGDLADADDETDGHQVDLSPGENTFKIKVTSEDESENETYTIVVERSEDITLVKNTHLTREGRVRVGDSTNGLWGQRFTTGTHNRGYELTSIGVYVHAVNLGNIDSMTLRIHEFDDSKSNDLGELVANLESPEPTAGEVNFFDAPDDTTLDAQTEYIVNLDIDANIASDLEFGDVSDNDQMGAAGWLIEDALRSGGNILGSTSMMIEVRGILQSTPRLTVSDAEVAEGSGNTLDFVVTLSPPPREALTVSASTQLQTAEPTLDYSPVTIELNFAAGEATKTVSVTIIDDGEDEVDETVGMLLERSPGPSPNVVFARPLGTGTIRDNDSLANLEIKDNDDNILRLSPAFSPLETEYAVSLRSEVDRITIIPTVAANHTGATIAVVDSIGVPIVDADTTKPEHQVNITRRSQTVKVKVTAPNTVLTTYIISISRFVPSPVSTNDPPRFLEGDSTTREIGEHAGGPIRLGPNEFPPADLASRGVGPWVRATDPDGDQLYYTLAKGDVSKFHVDLFTGRIGTKRLGQYIIGPQTEATGLIDYETQSSYRLRLMVHDTWGGNDYIDVTVEIIDLVEPPLTPGPPTVASGSPTSLNVSWNAPDNAGRPAITGYDLRYRRAGDTVWQDGPQGASGATATIAGLEMETLYQVQVRAVNHEGIGDWSASMTGSTATPTTPTLRFGDSAYFAPEGSGVVVTVVLSPAASSEVTVPLTTTERDGASSADYSGVTASITFPAGSSSQSFTVTAADDGPDSGESLLLELGEPPDGVDLGSPVSATVSIHELSGGSGWQAWFEKASYTATEGGQSATVTVGLSRPWRAGQTLTLPLWTPTPQGGASTADFSGVPSSVSFAPGTTRTSFEVTAADDGRNEYGESVLIQFGRGFPSNVKVGRGPARTVVHLADSGEGTPVKVSFGAGSYRAVEGGANAEVTVKLDRAPGRRVRIPLTTHYSNYEMRSRDYSGVPGSVTFGATDTEKTFTVTAVNDDDRDIYDTLEIRFSDLPRGVSQEGPSTVVHLNDNRDVPAVRVHFSNSILAIREGVHNTYPHVRADRRPDARLVIPLTVERLGGATGEDYRVPAWVAIDPHEDDHQGSFRQGFLIEVLEDADIDPGESLRITFGLLPKGVSLNTRHSTEIAVAMIDNDGDPRLSVSDAVATEGEDASLDFWVMLSPAETVPVTVDYTTAAGTATPGSDYDTATGKLRFGAGETAKTVSVPIIDDPVEDDGETMSLILSGPSGAAIYDGVATGTIRNTEDTELGPMLRVSDPEAVEGEDATLDFVVTLSPAASETVTVAYATSDGTAAAGSDYTARNGTLTFAAGETTKTISITIQDDDVAEGDGETVNLTLSNPSGAEIDYGDGLGKIRDASLTVEFQRVPASHDGTTAFTVRLKFSAEVASGTKAGLRNLLSVSGANTKRALRVDDRLDLFDFTFEPTGNDDVTISLGPSPTDCTAADAVCTSGGTALTGTTTVEVPGPEDSSGAGETGEAAGAGQDPGDGEEASALEAEFRQLPEGHDGTTAFTFQVAFTRELADGSGRKLRRALSATGGTVKSVRRVEDARDLYTVKFEPTGNDDMTISLGPSSTDCTANDAVCAGDGTALTGTVSETVPGPAAASDAGESDSEGEASDEFTMTFQNAPDSHDGSDVFTIRLQFTRDLAAGTKKQLRRALSVSGADMKVGVRVDDRMDLFDFNFKPTGTDDVVITLGPSGTDCTANDAVCTDDGTALTGTATVTVPYAAP